MVRRELPEPLVIETGLTLKLEFTQRGRLLRLRLTLPVNPFEGVTVMLSVALELIGTLMVPEEAPRAKSGDGPETTSVTFVEKFRVESDSSVPFTVMVYVSAGVELVVVTFIVEPMELEPEITTGSQR